MTSDTSVPSSASPISDGVLPSDGALDIAPISVDSEGSASIAVAPDKPAEGLQERDLQVRLRSEGGKLLLLLPPEIESEETNPASSLTWSEVLQQLKQRLNAGERLWQADTSVHLIARDRLLDGRQLQAIADALTEAHLRLTRVYTSRRQTAVAAATTGYSVEQQSSIAQLNPAGAESAQAMEEPLYLQTTLRSGGDVRHNGTVIILGDLNPGSSVVANGDILVWGRLRGTAHAGAKGNAQCLIMALQMEPTQIRIADFVARAPENPPAQYYPEVAYVAPQGTIRISRALEFSRAQAVGDRGTLK
ncbi:septum site-determining protein MinC [Phormidium sp. CLA17]|uniref:septum site-determining protein MinC n=1 Tax=Leptolyngbya sp. Cla-17 TaxID=2803751 RepID=UPI0014911DBE|nr:septum site-determining protein MinC [Leptolyngbya sp. Cla-17]MBM0742254.1 septum site-determining protein MinC [Leptolyngbya sp. Cla-17]